MPNKFTTPLSPIQVVSHKVLWFEDKPKLLIGVGQDNGGHVQYAGRIKTIYTLIFGPAPKGAKYMAVIQLKKSSKSDN